MKGLNPLRGFQVNKQEQDATNSPRPRGCGKFRDKRNEYS